jgi:putative nucleotidyltransferase with HDIG domain
MKPNTEIQRLETLSQISLPAECAEGSLLVSRERMLSVMMQANELGRADTLETLFAQTLDLILAVAEAESATLFLYDPGTDELVFSAARGDDESQGFTGLRLKKHLWIVDPLTSKTKVIIVGEVLSDPILQRIINMTRVSRLRNTIVIPLLSEEKTFGVIQVFNYNQCELDLLDVLANRFVIEAERLMTLEMTQQSNQRLRLLVDVIGKVSGTLDRSELLQIVPEQAARLTEAERSSLFLVDGANDELGFHASYQAPAEPVQKLPAAGRPDWLNKLVFNLSSARLNAEKQTGQSRRPKDEFGFATRSAITVSLQESRGSRGVCGDLRNSTVGGLTVLKMRGEAFNDEDVQLLEILASQTSVFLQAAEMFENANDLFLDVIKALVAAIDAKDRSTQGHSLRVLDYALAIAKELGLDASTISDVRIGSLLHDVGKIGVPDHILRKPGILSREEYKVMKKHPLYGKQILSQVRVLQSALPGIAEHHERLDGSGYPYGLEGSQISIAGRVIAVADVFDAMTTDRPYRKAISVPDTLSYLTEEGGKLFDRHCVQALKQVVEQRPAPSASYDTERNGDGRNPSPFPQDLPAFW